MALQVWIVFFTFTNLLAFHTIPAAWGINKKPLQYLFTFTCVWCIVSAFFGYRTLRDYDKDSVKAEKYLLIEYSLITLGAYGAGFVEFTGIGAKVKYRLAEGVWKHYEVLSQNILAARQGGGRCLQTFVENDGQIPLF